VLLSDQGILKEQYINSSMLLTCEILKIVISVYFLDRTDGRRTLTEVVLYF